MLLVVGEGLGLLAGLNRSPKRSFLTHYSLPIGHRQVLEPFASYRGLGQSKHLLDGGSFSLHVHSMP